MFTPPQSTCSSQGCTFSIPLPPYFDWVIFSLLTPHLPRKDNPPWIHQLSQSYQPPSPHPTHGWNRNSYWDIMEHIPSWPPPFYFSVCKFYFLIRTFFQPACLSSGNWKYNFWKRQMHKPHNWLLLLLPLFLLWSNNSSVCLQCFFSFLLVRK